MSLSDDRRKQIKLFTGKNLHVVEKNTEALSEFRKALSNITNLPVSYPLEDPSGELYLLLEKVMKNISPTEQEKHVPDEEKSIQMMEVACASIADCTSYYRVFIGNKPFYAIKDFYLAKFEKKEVQ